MKQKTYTKDTNYIDEWYLECPGATFGVVSYYDQGFEERFTDDFGWSEYKIAKVQNMVSQKFWLFFDLNIVPMYIPYRSKADDCKISTYGRVQSDNISKACAHAPDCLTWDKLQSTYGSGNDRMSRVLWTGHILKDNKQSVSFKNGKICIITPAYLYAGEVIMKDASIYIQILRDIDEETSEYKDGGNPNVDLAQLEKFDFVIARDLLAQME